MQFLDQDTFANIRSIIVRTCNEHKEDIARQEGGVIVVGANIELPRLPPLTCRFMPFAEALTEARENDARSEVTHGLSVSNLGVSECLGIGPSLTEMFFQRGRNQVLIWYDFGNEHHFEYLSVIFTEKVRADMEHIFNLPSGDADGQ